MGFFSVTTNAVNRFSDPNLRAANILEDYKVLRDGERVVRAQIRNIERNLRNAKDRLQAILDTQDNLTEIVAEALRK